MKVLFISHFREGSDFSKKAMEYAHAMIEAGLDLVIRDINVNPGKLATHAHTHTALPLGLVL